MQQSKLSSVHPTGTAYADIGDAVVPWEFGGIKTEYEALRTKAVVADYSAGGLIAVTGDAVEFLNHVVARDVEYLGTERCMTSLMLDDAGAPVDLLTIYGLDDGLLLESSAGRTTATLEHLRACARGNVDIIDLRSERTIVGIEGPYAWATVSQLLDQELTTLPYESVVETEWDGEPLLFARAGFTGEYGYKVIGDLDVLERLWQELLGTTVPMGYATLEVAMTEVRQPVFHRELLDKNPLEAGANWLIDLNKGEFRGRDAVARMWTDGTAHAVIGLRVEAESGVSSIGADLWAGETRVGNVVHDVYSPSLQATLALASVDARFAAAGLELACGADRLSALTLSAPYVVPTSWGVPIF